MYNSKLNWKYFFLPVSLSVITLIISLIPLPKLQEVQFIPNDKLGHLLAFLLLMFSYLWAFNKQKTITFSEKKITALSFVICIILGGGIELLQHYLPIQRYGDWFDFYFDIAGIILGMMIYRILSKKYASLFGLILMASMGFSQSIESSQNFQDELDREFGDAKESPLDSADLTHFEKLDFFPVDEKYIVEATLDKQNSPIFFGMETTTARRPEYRVWAIAHFTLDGVECSLTIYQNKKLMNTLDYGDYLFLPYSDLSNSKSTYKGGRYVDLRITDGDTIIIDFNKSYNPYCAYSDRYSCPIVPAGNELNVSVNAGVKKYH